MQGTIETYEFGKTENGVHALRFLIQKDVSTVWAGVKDFDKLVAVFCSSKGQTTRIIGNNGQPGAVYTCHHVIQHHGDVRDESRTLKYQINGVDEINKKLTLTISETSNGQQISRSDTSISIEKYSLNQNFTVYKTEANETISTGKFAKYVPVLMFLPFFIIGIVLASRISFFFIVPMLIFILFTGGCGFLAMKNNLNNAQNQIGELVDLLRTYFLNIQSPQVLTSATTIPEAIMADDIEQVKFAQVV
eukprot:snap_masked-scaffold_37-processed-gene-1.36-mRNA-1 protein AED:1.00 eAED:1.00 QI:0/-1/0/0/-1/1/1/0/247